MQRGQVHPLGGPQGQVADAGVARQALVGGAVEGDGPGLAHIVAPHACYKKRSCLRLIIGRYRHKSLGKLGPRLARAHAIQVHHRLAHIHADLPGRHGQCRAGEGQYLGGVGAQRAAEHGECGAGGAQLQGAGAQGRYLVHTRQAGHRFGKAGGQQGGVAPRSLQGRAHVQRRGQHRVQPLDDRAAKAGHHHRQRYGQAQAGHHAAHGNGGGAAHAAGALQRQQGERVARCQRLQALQQPGHAPGQQRNAAHQQQANRHVGRQWNAKNGRKRRQ